jgi:N-acetylmuramoyl-L-alanine amidase
MATNATSRWEPRNISLFEHPSPYSHNRIAPVALILLHSDASPSVEQTLAYMATPNAAKEDRKSYHYSIGRDGRVYRQVHESRVAWHAGESVWRGRQWCNAFSIGVNLSNRQDGFEKYPMAQLEMGAILVANLLARHTLPMSAIAMHSQVSPGRKHDPAPGGPFDLMGFLSLVQAATATRADAA